MKFFKYLLNLYKTWKTKRKHKKMLDEIRKRDPFIYD